MTDKSAVTSVSSQLLPGMRAPGPALPARPGQQLEAADVADIVIRRRRAGRRVRSAPGRRAAVQVPKFSQ